MVGHTIKGKVYLRMKKMNSRFRSDFTFHIDSYVAGYEASLDGKELEDRFDVSYIVGYNDAKHGIEPDNLVTKHRYRAYMGDMDETTWEELFNKMSLFSCFKWDTVSEGIRDDFMSDFLHGYKSFDEGYSYDITCPVQVSGYSWSKANKQAPTRRRKEKEDE